MNISDSYSSNSFKIFNIPQQGGSLNIVLIKVLLMITIKISVYISHYIEAKFKIRLPNMQI